MHSTNFMPKPTGGQKLSKYHSCQQSKMVKQYQYDMLILLNIDN